LSLLTCSSESLSDSGLRGLSLLGKSGSEQRGSLSSCLRGLGLLGESGSGQRLRESGLEQCLLLSSSSDFLLGKSGSEQRLLLSSSDSLLSTSGSEQRLLLSSSDVGESSLEQRVLLSSSDSSGSRGPSLLLGDSGSEQRLLLSILDFGESILEQRTLLSKCSDSRGLSLAVESGSAQRRSEQRIFLSDCSILLSACSQFRADSSDSHHNLVKVDGERVEHRR